MTPLKQLIAGPRGDCFRTVIASLLDLPAIAVPHFFETPDEAQSWKAVDTFLASHGLAFTMLHFDAQAVDTPSALMGYLQFLFEDTYVVLMGRGTSDNHAVIVLNGEIVNDPAWSNRGITGPLSNGFYTVGLIVPLAMMKR